MTPTAVAHRHLSVLRRTYPAWDIVRGRDEHGRECWCATLIFQVTDAMRAAGVVEMIRRDDGVSLAGALIHQARLLHSIRAIA
jgi:hypothetical protein